MPMRHKSQLDAGMSASGSHMYQDESTRQTLGSYPYLSFLIDNITPGRES